MGQLVRARRRAAPSEVKERFTACTHLQQRIQGVNAAEGRLLWLVVE